MTNEWIEWKSGGECPIKKYSPVEIIVGNYCKGDIELFIAHQLNWKNGAKWFYRIYQTPRELELEERMAINKQVIENFMNKLTLAKKALEFYADLSNTEDGIYRKKYDSYDNWFWDDGGLAKQALKEINNDNN